jgi:hypothetical protein
MAETQKDQITKDDIYNTVEPDDFAAMIECDRYLERASAFDKIISATHDHFWDPMDKRYIDFSEPFDVENDGWFWYGCLGQAVAKGPCEANQPGHALVAVKHSAW